MKTNQEIALEVAKALRQDDLVASLELCTRFLAAVDAERGKDAVCHLYRDMYSGGKNGVLRVCRVTPNDDAFPVFRSPTIPQWQPIDTAPKDGSRIMLLFAGGLPEFGYWEDQRYNKNPSPYWNGDCDRVFGVRYYKINPPTHWMPLPPPPAGVTK